jgi:hypothetical protein
MPLLLTNQNNQGNFILQNVNGSGSFTARLSGYNFNSSALLSWPSSSTGYTLYNGGVTNTDDGFTSAAIKLPVSMSTNNQSSINLYVSTNGYFTLGSGDASIRSLPDGTNPATMAANPGDNWLNPGLTNTDGDVQNVYFITGSDGNNRNFIKLLVYAGTFNASTTPTSWLANFYRDGTYQWLETRVKLNVRGSAGPYNSTSVAQTASTSSRVWRGDLTGRNWVYMGTGSISI